MLKFSRFYIFVFKGKKIKAQNTKYDEAELTPAEHLEALTTESLLIPVTTQKMVSNYQLKKIRFINIYCRKITWCTDGRNYEENGNFSLSPLVLLRYKLTSSII